MRKFKVDITKKEYRFPPFRTSKKAYEYVHDLSTKENITIADILNQMIDYVIDLEEEYNK
jgi:hypothetical protein